MEGSQNALLCDTAILKILATDRSFAYLHILIVAGCNDNFDPSPHTGYDSLRLQLSI